MAEILTCRWSFYKQIIFVNWLLTEPYIRLYIISEYLQNISLLLRAICIDKHYFTDILVDHPDNFCFYFG